MVAPLGKTFVQIDLDAEKYNKGVVDIKTTTKKKLSEIEKAWKGLGKKSEKTYDEMRAAVNKNYDKIKKHSLSTADDILRAEKAKNEKIARINKQQFGDQKSWIDKAKKHWMALSAAAVAAVYAIGRAIQTSLSMYADWEVALNRLGNVSDETIPEMREKILSISPALGSVTELTKGYYQVLSAGVTEPLEAMDLLTTSAKMSKEATILQADAVKGLAALMGTYTTELGTANDAADLLYKTEALGITTVGELIPLVGNLATQAEAVGLKANEMAAALAQITTSGAGTNISVTQLQSLLTALSKKFALLPPEIKKYGSATAAVKALGFQGVLKEIMAATGGNSTALIKMLGRQEAYLALLQLSKNEFGSYSAKLEEMTDKAGSFDDAWKRYAKTLTAIWDTFKNTIGKQAILIGETLAPAIKGVIEWAGKWLEKNEEFITQQVSIYYDAAATALNAIATALKAIGTAWNAAMGYFLGPDTPIEIHKESIAQAEKMITLLRSQRDHAEVMFKAAAFGNQVWADAIERINGLIREQRGIIDINKKSLKDWNKEATKKGPEKQIKANKDAVDEITDAIEDLGIYTASALDMSASDWEDYTREVVANANESYIAWKDALKDTAAITASELNIADSYWEDYTRDVIDTSNKSYNAWKKSLDDTSNKTGKIAKEMIGFFADVITSVASTAENIASKVSSVISEIWSGLKSVMGMVGGVITFFITFPGDLKESLERFAESINELPKIVEEFFHAADIFFKNLPKIITTFIDSVGVFIDGLVEALPGVVDALIAELPRLVDAFIEALPVVMDALIAGAEQFTLAIVEEIPRLIEAIMAEIPGMVTSFMEVFLPAILDMIPKLIEAILQGIPDIIKALSAGMPTVVTSLIDAIVDLIPILAEELPVIVEALTNSMIKDSPRIIDALIKGVPRIVEALVKAIGRKITPGGGTDITIGDILDPFDIFHKGGIVGQESQTSRFVSSAAFATAPRAHKGFMPDEVPIVAKRGEGVFTPEQMAALGSVNINSPLIHIGGNLIADKQTFDDFAEQIDYAITKRSKRVYA